MYFLSSGEILLSLDGLFGAAQNPIRGVIEVHPVSSLRLAMDGDLCSGSGALGNVGLEAGCRIFRGRDEQVSGG
jgi:hypothetical protein